MTRTGTIDRFLVALALNPRNPRGKTRLLNLLTALKPEVQGDSEDGVRLSVRLSSAQDLTFFRRQGNNAMLSTAIGELEPGAVFVDVGANIGYFSLLAAQRIGPGGFVLAFEPSLREFQRLIRNIALNHVGNVYPLNLGISDNGSLGCIDLGVGHTGMNRLVAVDDAAATLQPCAVVSLDTLLPALLGERCIDLLKIDVEGLELAVLLGAANLLRRGRIRRICVEVTPGFLARRRQSAEQMYGFLSTYGFSPQNGVQPERTQWDELFTLVQ